jgi:hypothetical protein
MVLTRELIATNSWWGGLSVSDVNWDFGREPLKLQVDAKGKAAWSYQFDDSVSWSDMVIGQRTPTYGQVNYHLRLSQSQNLIQGADSQSLVRFHFSSLPHPISLRGD